MPWKIRSLVLSFLVFDFLWSELPGIMERPDTYWDRLTPLVLTSSFSFFLYALVAYTLLWYLWDKWRHIWIFLLILLSWLPLIFFRYGLEEILMPALFGFDNYNDTIGLRNYVLDNKFYAILNSGFGVAFYFVQYGRHKEMARQQLLLQTRTAELRFLQSQINPHFLFNSLNNIYALVYQKSELALQAVQKLSSLLRYMLYEKKSAVPLSEEIHYLLNYIDLQKMRYDFEFPLRLQLEIEKDIEIPPLLLIPMVENAFKHGHFASPDQPLEISLICRQAQLQYRVSNQVAAFEKDSGGGIGLENIARRLAWLYPDRHSLHWQEDEKRFEILMTLQSHHHA